MTGHRSSAADRNRLIRDHIPLARAVAKKTCKRTFNDDIIADGYVGLVQAARAYDPARNIAFSSFAWPRIRGAIIDGARSCGFSRHHYAQILKDQSSHDGPHLTANPSPDVGGRASHQSNPSDIEENLDRKRSFVRAMEEIAKLSDREQQIAQAYYFGGRTFQQIAAQIGCSVAMTFRLHAQILRTLRAALAVEEAVVLS